VTTQRQELGANLLENNRCSFLVWAPKADKVEVHITHPRERNIPMNAAARGYFQAIAENVGPGALYRYRVDGENERPDPASRYQPLEVHGPSQVVDSQFNWGDEGWRGIPLERYVLYELHVGTFTPSGTFDAIVPRMGDLKELGVTAIEIMPVSQFSGNRNWGYDGVYPYAVQASYGGPAAFKTFINACHQQEMAEVLDVVYNHLGPEGNYLDDFGHYFTDLYKTPWGRAINFDSWHSDEVRRYFIENALRWITEFHVDALRLDAVHAIVDPSARPFLQELATAVHERARELKRDIYLFPESDRNDARVVTSTELGGWGHDAVWNDDFHHALHVLLTGEQVGYYQDFHGIDDLARSFREGFLYSGQFSQYRQRRHGNSSKHLPGERFVVFTQNHDQVGNRLLGERLVQLVSFDQLKLAAGILLLSPYIPLLFMGEEYAEPAPFQYFVSHGDPDLIEAVRRGRKEEFSRFNWNGEIPDPESEATFHSCRLNWDLRAHGQHQTLWNFYKKLLELRQSLPALSALDKNKMEVKSVAENKVLLVRRWSGSSEILAAFHFNSTAIELKIPFPAGRWRKLLDSADSRWAGAGSDITESLVSFAEMGLHLKPWTFVLFGNDEKCE
jgi:maltooligosyltrehalose trehalohydrolase